MDFLVLFSFYLAFLLICVIMICIFTKSQRLKAVVLGGAQVCARVTPQCFQRAVQTLLHQLFHTRHPAFLALHLLLQGLVYAEYTYEVFSYCRELEFSLPCLLLPYVLLSVNLVFFTLTCSTNPGTITKTNVSLLLQVYEFDEVMFPKNSRCSTCDLRKPARSKHCRVCDRCVHRFDHHCVWVNNCIGAWNTGYFLIYLLTLTASAATIAILSAAFLLRLVAVSNLYQETYLDDLGRFQAVDTGFLIQRLNSLQELQLLEIMCSYFQEQSKDSVRQIIFSSLFSPQGNKADDSRMSLLGKLVSMAVAVCRIPVLECAASWLQRTPVVYCVRLARALVDDYCCLVPGSVQTLKQIFSASPRFCCQFITSVTALYDLSSDDLIPPLDLLEMIVSWIFEDPRLILITFLNTPIAANLPIGFLELTPLIGLIRWCVKAPLAYKRKKPCLSNGHISHKVAKDSGTGTDRDSHLLYSQLHLSVLQVLTTLQLHLTEKNLYGRLGLILFDHMVPLVEEINRLADELNPLNASQEIELALDRLAQALQVAMTSGALLCTRDDLRTLCSRLPHNNLLQLVISGPVQQSPHTALPPGFYPHIHTPPLAYGAVPAHPAAHPALPTHPGHTFLSGVTFPFRPIR